MNANFLQENPAEVLRVNLVGEMDHHNAMRLRERIDETVDAGMYAKVVFDLSDVTFMDSSGIGVLLGRYKKLTDKGILMEIEGARPGIDRIVKMAGLYQIIKKREKNANA